MHASQAVHPHHIHLTQQFYDAVKTATAERKTQNYTSKCVPQRKSGEGETTQDAQSCGEHYPKQEAGLACLKEQK